MNNLFSYIGKLWARGVNRLGLGIRSKLIIIFLLVKVIPLILLAAIAWRQFTIQGRGLTEIAVNDSSAALNDSAVENIERITTDTARRVADFLYSRDDDILYLATLEPTEENYRKYVEKAIRGVVRTRDWILAPDGRSWQPAAPLVPAAGGGVSTNTENNDMNGFRHRPPIPFEYDSIPIYDEITFVDLDGNELIKVIPAGSPKTRFPMDQEKKNVSRRENTYVKAETYFAELGALRPGQIYVSDVIGAYVGSNYIGMYTPPVVAEAAEARGYAIDYTPEEQAYAAMENPHGRRFEGIVRWASPVADANGEIIGYVTLALNYDHIMEFVDHITPMNERYVELPSAFDGNYAFIWDYKCRNIAHPRHHSIVGFDPETGEPQIPWLEESMYNGWRESGLPKWTDYAKDYPTFSEQSRAKRPAPDLTKAGLVGLDGRYLNNAPQCTGWMDLTRDGGSGSFYILWSGLYKLNTAAAIPYYTGHYAPSEANGYSRHGFGFVAIGSGLEFFTMPARDTEQELLETVADNLRGTFFQLTSTTAVLVVAVVLIAIWMASFLANSITRLISGISRFRAGERQFRFYNPVKDEFGTLADSFDDMADSINASVKNPLSIIDMTGKIIYMNEYGLEICRMTLPQAVGMPYNQISIYPAGSRVDPVLALQEGREAEIYYSEDSGRHCRGIANYFLSKTGEKIGYIIETIDVTEMVLKQIALGKAVQAANQANEHKGEFLARMSHEIRTPMNAIIGLTNIVRRSLTSLGGDREKAAEVEENLTQIEASSQHLLSLLSDILDISKIEAGKITLTAEVVDLPKLVETVTGIINPRCLEKSITFIINYKPFQPTTFLSDSLRLRQILINLLGNAVKFTPENGLIELHVVRKDQLAGKTLVEFKIRDSGIGISEEALQTIFQPFEQAGSGITRKYGGTGLGLAISQSIVKMFDSNIQVESRLGEGSEFTFSIWLKEVKKARPADAPVDHKRLAASAENSFPGKRVLLVDDVDLNRKVARSMLKITGMQVDEAADGVEAVKCFEESPEYGYDLIMMDVQMPIMDGYEASRTIRALNRPDAATVPIVALTANAFTEDIEKALQAGMNEHIAKPVRLDKLIETLSKFLGGPPRE